MKKIQKGGLLKMCEKRRIRDFGKIETPNFLL
jgi:hypothetical protein